MSKTEYHGKEALDFADANLRKIRTGNWEVEYDDPKTSDRWLMDWPQSALHGGGPARLRKLPK